jgi:hypothetical protein
MEHISANEVKEKERIKGTLKDQEKNDIIKVRAIISCPNCGYNRSFTNNFKREAIELLIVSLKVFEFLTCDCGSLIDLTLEFET